MIKWGNTLNILWQSSRSMNTLANVKMKSIWKMMHENVDAWKCQCMLNMKYYMYRYVLIIVSIIMLWAVLMFHIMKCGVICILLRNWKKEIQDFMCIQTSQFKWLFGRTSLITLNFSSTLKKCTETLKSVNLGYLPFYFFQFQPSVRIFL
jgi:hypothetical protein